MHEKDSNGLRWRLASEETVPDTLFDPEEHVAHHVGVGAYRGLEFYEVNAKRVINRVPAASRMPFQFTINAYRGCSHACSYCFARPTHAYLGLGIGEDFDRRIVVKVNAVERARGELFSSRWSGAHIAMGTNTDPYQKAEGKYHLTKGLIGVLAERANPFSILTKSTLVLRDIDLLVEAAARTDVQLNLSIGTLDREIARLVEPGTPPPAQRVEAVRRLNERGISCGVLIAPVIPGLSDDEEHLEAVAAACRDAGAVSATAIALHLRPGVHQHFFEFLDRERPDLVELYERRFAGRAYQPKAEQARVTEIVQRVFGRSHAARPRRGVPAPSAPEQVAPLSEQLGLFSRTG